MNMLLGEAMALEGGIPFKNFLHENGKPRKGIFKNPDQTEYRRLTDETTISGVKMPILSSHSDGRFVTGCKYVNLVKEGYQPTLI